SSPVDYIGIALLVLGVGLLQVVLDKGNDEDWFSSTPIIVMSIVSAISLICFVIWELDERHPIVNLRLFKDRNFAIGTLALMLGYAAFFAINIILPQWLQT
ncbi:MFS transporter, partial [Klebsiella pneumoniae]|nr:MFS transporter [Klebsiella pneumoniae]